MELVLKEELGGLINYNTTEISAIEAKQSAIYTIVDSKSKQVYENIKLRQDGETLVVEDVSGKVLFGIDGFFIKGKSATFYREADPRPETTVTSDNPLTNTSVETFEEKTVEVDWNPAKDEHITETSSGAGVGTWLLGGLGVAGAAYALGGLEDTTSSKDNNKVTVIYDLTAGTRTSSDGYSGFWADTDYNIIVKASSGEAPAKISSTFSAYGGSELGSGDTIAFVDADSGLSEDFRTIYGSGIAKAIDTNSGFVWSGSWKTAAHIYETGAVYLRTSANNVTYSIKSQSYSNLFKLWSGTATSGMAAVLV